MTAAREESQLAPESGARVTRDFLKLLELDDFNGIRTDEDIFVGPRQEQPQPRVFGGQVLAQSLIAAARTLDSDRTVHSMHGYFLRAGDAREPITFGVQRLRDGRSFSARRVHAYQGGVPILSMIASFQTEDSGVEHADRMPEGIPDPESLPTSVQLLGSIDHPVARHWAFERPFDIRHVNHPLYLSADPEPSNVNAVWMKTFAPLPDDPALHRAALAYASDYTLLEPIMRQHSITWTHPGITIASLDHAMWWHRPVRADEWLLYVQESPSAQSARGLSTGKIFSRDGRLVASVAQEGMVRIPEI